jgi:hypothetical protein
MTNNSEHPYFTAFKGSFSGILRWSQLDELWQKVVSDKEGGWYIYPVGEQPPEMPATADEIEKFIPEIDRLLRKEHDEDYCGVVYADNRENPEFIKIFDPNSLGTSCSTHPIAPLPGWILSKMQPVDLPAAMPQTGSRKRWWQKIFS